MAEKYVKTVNSGTDGKHATLKSSYSTKFANITSFIGFWLFFLWESFYPRPVQSGQNKRDTHTETEKGPKSELSKKR